MSWPDRGDLLALTREAQEHERAWALVRGLARVQLERRRQAWRDPQEHVARIHDLEAKVINQKAHLRELEEVVRPFEAETERLLVNGLEGALLQINSLLSSLVLPPGAPLGPSARSLLEETATRLVKLLQENRARKGPRPS